ncbi:MAG TPA: exopolyphosphatase, partial [Cyclobacteriaceae bacterium]|nr:exopolyphosphatase [Cyclobacteriaceae bacterium]
HFSEALNPLLRELRIHKPLTMVGSSGTFDTLSEIYCFQNKMTYHPDDPETPLTFASFQETYGKLIVKTRKERMEIEGMIEMRVDMIVVASCLIRFILDHHHFENIRVSSYSLKEGILASLKN